MILKLIASLAIAGSSFHPAVGAHPPTDSLNAWVQAEKTLGHMTAQRIYYQSLPPSFTTDNFCSGLPLDATCVVSYKTPNQNVVSYVKSVPADRKVVLIFHHEPECGGTFPGHADFPSEQAFLNEFEIQSNLIRSADNPAVKVAMVACVTDYQLPYSPSQPGHDASNCGWIPPRQYVDFYYGDIYDNNVSGAWNIPGMLRWLQCTRDHHRRRGIAEWGIPHSTGCNAQLTRAEDLGLSYQFFERRMPRMQMLLYFWVDGLGVCQDWQFHEPDAVLEWHRIENGTVYK